MSPGEWVGDGFMSVWRLCSGQLEACDPRLPVAGCEHFGTCGNSTCDSGRMVGTALADDPTNAVAAEGSALPQAWLIPAVIWTPACWCLATASHHSWGERDLCDAAHPALSRRTEGQAAGEDLRCHERIVGAGSDGMVEHGGGGERQLSPLPPATTTTTEW